MRRAQHDARKACNMPLVGSRARFVSYLGKDHGKIQEWLHVAPIHVL